MFIAFDGLDGVGKTTQSLAIYEKLKQQFKDSHLTNMGSFGYIDEYMKLIKEGTLTCSAEIRELVYYFEGILFSDDLISKHVKKDDSLLITDRYILSYFAYGPLNGIDSQQILNLTKKMIWPDIYFFIDLEPEVSLQRISLYRKIDIPEIGFKNTLNNKDENENKKSFIVHQHKVRKNFYNAIKLIDKPVYIINGNQSVDDILNDILNILKDNNVILQ